MSMHFLASNRSNYKNDKSHHYFLVDRKLLSIFDCIYQKDFNNIYKSGGIFFFPLWLLSRMRDHKVFLTLCLFQCISKSQAYINILTKTRMFSQSKRVTMAGMFCGSILIFFLMYNMLTTLKCIQSLVWEKLQSFWLVPYSNSNKKSHHSF